MAHILKHWWKYYLGAGLAYAGYQVVGKNRSLTDFGSRLTDVAAWPVRLAQDFMS